MAAQNLDPVLLKIWLSNDWVTALKIPSETITNYSTKPRKWLDYLGYTVTGADGVLSLSPDASEGACDLDLPTNAGDAFFYHMNGPHYYLDPKAMDDRTSCHSSSMHDSSFQDALEERDRACVFSEALPRFCVAAHLLPHSKGDPYIEQQTYGRSGGNLTIDSIDDIKNGLFLIAPIYGAMGSSMIAFLQTPVRALKSSDVAENVEPESYRLTYHSFVAEDPTKSLHGHAANVRSPLPDNWPPGVIFNMLYGNAALVAWGPPSFIEALRNVTDEEYYPKPRGSKQSKERERETKTTRQARGRKAGVRASRKERYDSFDLLETIWRLNCVSPTENARRAKEAEAEDIRRSSEKVATWLETQ